MAEIHADITRLSCTKGRDFIGVFSNPPIFTVAYKKKFGEHLTKSAILVYSQMARGLLSQQGITVG